MRLCSVSPTGTSSVATGRGTSSVGRAVAAALLLGVVVGGCGRPPDIVADPERAASILETVLAAWRDGETCADLQKRSPAIHVADERWLGGAALTSFTIGEGRPFGPSTRFEVTLVGPPPLGTRKAVYAVSTQPSLSVARTDERD